MNITYTLTPDELTEIQSRYAASLEHYFGFPWHMRWSRLILIPVLAGAATLLIPDFLKTGAIVLGCILADEGIRRAYRHFFIQRLYSPINQTFQLQQWRVTLQESGLSFDGELAQTVYFWKTIQFLSRDDRFLYVFISMSQLVAIPMRAFKDAAEADIFCEAMRGRMKQGVDHARFQ